MSFKKRGFEKDRHKEKWHTVKNSSIYLSVLTIQDKKFEIKHNQDKLKIQDFASFPL